MNELWNMDCLEFENTQAATPPAMVFADPPDNIGLGYAGYDDRLMDTEYRQFMEEVIAKGIHLATRGGRGNFWLSYYHKHDLMVKNLLHRYTMCGHQVRTFIWRFTFGQHRESDFGSGYRPIVRVGSRFESVRVESERQRIGDKRANPDGRVPDDVFEFPRVVGNASERRIWHPTQHPVALMQRIIGSSTLPGEHVLDMFAGTGSCHRAAVSLGRTCTSIERSAFYCGQLSSELSLKIKSIQLPASLDAQVVPKC